jgi:hypothetical protein
MTDDPDDAEATDFQFDDADDSEPMSATDPSPAAERAASDDPAQPTDTDDGTDRGRIERVVRYGALAALSLLALVALLQFYVAVSNTIRLWVASEYRSLFTALFNLVVLLLAAAGVSWQVRALR